MIPLFVMSFTAIQTLTSYYSGVLSDKLGNFKILLLSFVFAIISIVTVQINLWIAFITLGLFTVLSLNAIRAYISQYANSKGFIFGVFYGGVAISSALGALVIGYIWKLYGFESVVVFSVLGMLALTFLLLILVKKQ
jgi:MFS family permease